jgi:TIR domain
MKQAAPFFLSYARHDLVGVERLRGVLAPLLKTSAAFRFEEWADQQILPGEHWRVEIERALEISRFGLLLVSPEFLASEFITQNELPMLLAKGMVVPVELQRVAFNGTMDLKGLEDRQVFRDSKGRSFDGCRSMPDRRKFAMELFARVVALLEKYPC